MKIKLILLFVTAILGTQLFLCPKVLAEEAVPQEVEFTVSIQNVLPVAQDILIDGGNDTLQLNEGGYNDAIITATVTDDNGCEDITDVTFYFYRTDIEGGSLCTPNTSNCYFLSGNEVGSGNTCNVVDPGDPDAVVDLSVEYVATIPIWYLANATDYGEFEATDWSAIAIPSDNEGEGVSNGSDTIEIQTLMAFGVTPSIEFGNMLLGETSSATDEYNTVITNTGNKAEIGIQVKSAEETAMVCGTGNVPIANLKFGASSITPYNDKTPLTVDYVTVENLSIPMGVVGNTGSVGWGLKIPVSGLSGDCSGMVVFTAF